MISKQAGNQTHETLSQWYREDADEELDATSPGRNEEDKVPPRCAGWRAAALRGTTMSAVDLSKQLADVQTALNIVWTLVTGFLVMLMQAGFALVESGLVREKNVAHTMGMNF